ncbi:hypothetical protein PGTUg99_002999 [Puccinia graminis f. sp. tritici]|uniref:Uncharacterized protein n=1 Tax=Puccinia graminis f. sp. tritici TaxID=56615 RepID=A0A5B0R534_PUCGR|nr:hypothetical protein PGTUg99_002999 [Puccinia graminis f. sp. tritici]
MKGSRFTSPWFTFERLTFYLREQNQRHQSLIDRLSISVIKTNTIEGYKVINRLPRRSTGFQGDQQASQAINRQLSKVSSSCSSLAHLLEGRYRPLIDSQANRLCSYFRNGRGFKAISDKLSSSLFNSVHHLKGSGSISTAVKSHSNPFTSGSHNPQVFLPRD